VPDSIFYSSTDFSTTCNVIRTFDKQEQFCKHLGKNDYSTLFLAENFNFFSAKQWLPPAPQRTLRTSVEIQAQRAPLALAAPQPKGALLRAHGVIGLPRRSLPPQMCSPSSTILGLCASQRQRREKRTLNVSYTTVSHAI
jgi:hypothetical protein